MAPPSRQRYTPPLAFLFARRRQACSFWLIVAFSRSRLCLTVESVGLILQSVLGGNADLFSVVELESQLFKFSIFNRQFGLHVYALRSFVCDPFKLFFHLWNPSGLARARISSTVDSGPRFDWEQVKSKKTSKSYAVVVGNGPSKSPPPHRFPDIHLSRHGSAFTHTNHQSSASSHYQGSIFSTINFCLVLCPLAILARVLILKAFQKLGRRFCLVRMLLL
jgi:hypothetical protein